MELSIILVNWNSIDYLQECIASVYEFTHEISFEVIVVDNASSDQNFSAITEAFPEVRVIKSPKNLGFAKANNLGFTHSLGDCALFLNPDTKLITPAINCMFDRLKLLPKAGVVGCKLLNTDLSVQTSCIQRFPTILNQVLDMQYLQERWPRSPLWNIGPLFADTGAPTPVEVISGACMMLKRGTFEEIGMFSEDYFMYAEDLDLCYKASRAGWNNYYVGEAAMIHHGGKSSGQRKTVQWATVRKFTSVQHFCVKTRGRVYGATYRVAMGATALGRLILLALAFPFAGGRLKQGPICIGLAKWIAVLKWAVGLDRSQREATENLLAGSEA